MTPTSPETDCEPGTDGPTRLTSLAHGGGCGCKLSPAVLRELLEGQFAASGFPQLLVGNGKADDAAVWELDDGRCLVATTDFFMPIVDDPHDFGRIAATNAISDIYAMGARPLFALAILGMPLDKLSTDQVRAMLAGGAAAAAAAGIPVAGGHSIDSAEPIYGLAVIGEAPSRDAILTNAGAKAGDKLILTKPIGVGIYSAAFKRGVLDEAGYREMIDTTTRLNAVGAMIARKHDVHAMTDITGFGLLGHGLEMARASGIRLDIQADTVPCLSQAKAMIAEGIVTGASARNWASVAEAVTLPHVSDPALRALLTDPQTSGGLLISVSSEQAQSALALLRQGEFPSAAIIGEARVGEPGIAVTL